MKTDCRASDFENSDIVVALQGVLISRTSGCRPSRKKNSAALSLYLSLPQYLSLSFQHKNGWCAGVKRNSAAISTAGKFASNWRDRGTKEGDGEL